MTMPSTWSKYCDGIDLISATLAWIVASTTSRIAAVILNSTEMPPSRRILRKASLDRFSTDNAK
jgi:hypothetical protein